MRMVQRSVKRVEVAPFAGAWIEIAARRGSKCAAEVAPFAGAWIEIVLTGEFEQLLLVAPFAGAWIEIRSITRWRVMC